LTHCEFPRKGIGVYKNILISSTQYLISCI